MGLEDEDVVGVGVDREALGSATFRDGAFRNRLGEPVAPPAAGVAPVGTELPADGGLVRVNRVTKGIYELGSTFKAFTVAMALDSGR